MNATATVEGFTEQFTELQAQFGTIESLLDPGLTVERIADLDMQMTADGFWNDQAAAAKLSGERTRLQRKLDNLEALRGELETVETFLELAREEDENNRAEVLDDIDQAVNALRGKLGKLQEDSLFTGEYDAGPAIVSIHSGEGGVDAQDWAEMLMRMYLRFSEKRGFKVDVTSRSDGEEAGIKSASMTVQGENAYGVMNAESGVHRLVRLSPFDSAHRRQTSFAQVEVYPLFEDDVAVDLDESELRIDTYRASGAGGQHVNKTDSAVRITHLPTNTVVQCQNERSQTQNRETAMKMLMGRLFELERQKRESLISAEKGEAQNVGFGSQIRSYVMQPYQMVKDLRTRYESGNVQAVLDGDIDEFIRAYLLHKAQGGSSARAIDEVE